MSWRVMVVFGYEVMEYFYETIEELFLVSFTCVKKEDQNKDICENVRAFSRV